MLAAERTREVYRAWNAVCAHTREGSHATGLHYRPETNELIVYMDSAAWTQEMTMLREIIRARIVTGVDVAGLVFMTSKEGYASRASSAAAGTADGDVAVRRIRPQRAQRAHRPRAGRQRLRPRIRTSPRRRAP